jgi:hypothetical protein
MYRGKQLFMTLFCILVLLLSIGSSFVQSKKTQKEDETEGAGVGATIDNAVLPGIQKDWTAINITIQDNFGLQWNRFLPGGDLSFYAQWWMQTWWVYVYKVPKGMLGYTSIKFVPEYPDGWAVKIEPSTIGKTCNQMTHHVIIYAQVNELASDYNPLIKIKCIRYLTDGVEYASSYIYLPLKAASLNFAYVRALETTKKAPPRSIVSFPIEVTNKGEYRNTFQFNVAGQLGTYGLVAQQSLTLNSGETQTIQLQVITPEVFYDVGTPRKVDISIYPLGNPTEKISLSVIVMTEGFYISPLITLPIGAIIILVLISYFIFFYLRNKREQKLYGKPNKPWNIPEEKAYLQDLKQDDKEAYKKERLMMEDEYKSALISYDYNRRTVKKTEGKKLRESLSGLFKRTETTPKVTEKIEQKPKKKSTKPLLDIFKKSEKPRKTEQKKKEPSIPAEDTAKEKALLKIKSEQEKQLKKLKE